MQVNNQQGFTLFELLVVLAIIALGSSIILPSISSSDSKIFQAQLRELSAVLKYNRRHAVISGQTQLAQLFPYQDGQINNKKKGQWYSRGAEFSWLNKQNNNSQMINIKFFPQGGATGGTLQLRQGALQSQLIIDSFTGKLTLHEGL